MTVLRYICTKKSAYRRRKAPFMQHKIIERIEAKRAELNMSVRELAEKSGVPESTYNNMIHGRSKDPSYDRIRVLAIAVDLSPVEFMDAIDSGDNAQMPESLQKEIGKIATGYDLDYLANTFVHTTDMIASDFRMATQSRNEEFQRALRSKDDQFAIERKTFMRLSLPKTVGSKLCLSHVSS